MDWLIVVVPAVVSGVLGSIVTAYATQAGERRAARTDVRTKLQTAERLARHTDSVEARDQLTAALAQLEDAALTAALPRYLISFYCQLRLLAYDIGRDGAPGAVYDPQSARVISIRLANSAATLIVLAMWHPWLSRLARPWRMHRLRHIFANGLPREARQILGERGERRAWERSLLRGGRRSAPGQGKDARSTLDQR